jgi:hypothetical protein
MDAQIRSALRRLIAQEGGQNRAADRLGISHGYMADLLKNRRRPGPRVLRGLGLRRVVVERYEEVGG